MLNNRLHIKKAIYKIAMLQLFAVLLLSVAYLVFSNIESSYSAIFGGLICIIPSLFFAKKLFSHAGAQQAKKIFGDLFKGEAIKILLTVLMFAAVVNLIKVDLLALLVGYISAQLAFWCVPFMFKRTQQSVKMV